MTLHVSWSRAEVGEYKHEDSSDGDIDISWSSQDDGRLTLTS